MSAQAASAVLPLHDIHLPPAPGWWPPAPGWWLLAALSLVVLIASARLLRRWLRRVRRRRRLLAAFEQAVAGFDPQRQPLQRLRAAHDVLRRACRRDAPHALRLRGQAWLDYLDRGLADRPFAGATGHALLEAPYRPDCEAELAAAAIALIRRRLRAGLP